MTDTNLESTENGLPTKDDFNPWGPNNLDAEWAWDNFCGLTLEKAHAKFRERPEIYQEDFMFMGGKAFAFYFPVVERYLLDTPDFENEGDDRESWILAKCIENQFKSKTSQYVQHLADRVTMLSQFVQKNIRRFGYDEDERKKIAEAWQELQICVKLRS